MTDLNELLCREIKCPCGRTHFSSVKRIDIGADAVKRLPQHILELGYRKVFIVADRNTWKAAGESAASELENTRILFEKIILDQDEVIPDETVIGEILTAFPMDTDLVLAVGSGTINDLCKFISHRMRTDYIIFASAPSMDGFVSIGAALMLRHVKTTVDCHGPVAVIGDTAVLAAAPMKLIAAGMGDTLGKYTCLLDWKLSHIINGEYYCPEIVHLVEEALKTVNEQREKVLVRDPAAIKSLTEALVLTGIAMSFIGNSRPASGCEHHLSHYWEMKSIMEGKTPALHGAQVGVGAILAIRLYRKLAGSDPDFEAAKLHVYYKDGWENEMRNYYGLAAEGIIALEEKAHKNDPALRNERLNMTEKNWPEICRMIRSGLPETEEMEKLLSSFGAPINPAQIGISGGEVRNAVIAAKEVRDRYTLLQLLWDLGLSEEYAEDAQKYFESGQRLSSGS